MKINSWVKYIQVWVKWKEVFEKVEASR